MHLHLKLRPCISRLIQLYAFPTPVSLVCYLPFSAHHATRCEPEGAPLAAARRSANTDGGPPPMSSHASRNSTIACLLHLHIEFDVTGWKPATAAAGAPSAGAGPRVGREGAHDQYLCLPSAQCKANFAGPPSALLESFEPQPSPPSPATRTSDSGVDFPLQKQAGLPLPFQLPHILMHLCYHNAHT